MKKKKTQSQISKYLSYIDERFDDVVCGFEPRLKDFPPSTYSYIRLFFAFGVFFSFAGFFYYGFSDDVQSQYLTPREEAGEETGKCEEIPLSNTGEYLATKAGYWLGNRDGLFDYSDSLFGFQMNDYQPSEDEWAGAMGQFYMGLSMEAEVAKTRDLGNNLIFLMSKVFLRPDDATKSQMAYFTPSPSVVFNREITSGSVSNVNGDCPLKSISSYDRANSILSLQYNYEEFMNDAVCNQTLTPILFGYPAQFAPPNFEIKIDVRSLIVCLAMNLKLNTPDQMVEITALRRVETFDDGSSSDTNVYRHPKYPGMEPIICSSFTDGTESNTVCAMDKAGVIIYPIFNHQGNSDEYPLLCECPLSDELNDVHSKCHAFSFVSGFLYYNTVGARRLYQLIGRHTGGGQFSTLNNAAFNASFTGSAFGRSSSRYDPYLNQPEVRRRAYDFCDGECGIVIFTTTNILGGNGIPPEIINNTSDWAVSAEYYQLKQGACSGSFLPTAIAWERIIKTPFAPLTTDYSVCTPNTWSVVYDQIGITAGNVFGIVVPLIFLLLSLASACCMVLRKEKHHDPLKVETGLDQDSHFLIKEKEDVVETLAVKLLIVENQIKTHRKKLAAKKRELEHFPFDRIFSDSELSIKSGSSGIYSNKTDVPSQDNVGRELLYRNPSNGNGNGNGNEERLRMEKLTNSEGLSAEDDYEKNILHHLVLQMRDDGYFNPKVKAKDREEDDSVDSDVDSDDEM